jgi:UDP-arabinose 4-epimerase
MTLRVLVTGGAGYVGSHTCKSLAAAGALPIVYDNLSRGHEWAVKWGPFERGDITDADRLSEVIRTHRPDAVLHFAAYAYVGESVEDPAKYYWNNVVGTLTLLNVMRAEAVNRFVLSSTCSVYGTPEAPTIDESHRRAPINPYGRSKLVIEQCLEDYSRAYGLSAIGLRYFNAAGADPDGEIGEAHDPETHLIPLVLAAAEGFQPDVTVFGADHETPDGTCIRDFVHVSDLADAHVAAIVRLETSHGFDAFNLGSGSGNSVKEVIAAAERISGRAISVRHGERREGDPARLVASNAKARAELGWRPNRSDIDTILVTARNWMKSGK